MKPEKVLTFIICTLASLFFITLVFPKDGIKITDDFTLNFATAKELFTIDVDTLNEENLAFFQDIETDSLDEEIAPDTAAINKRNREVKDSTIRVNLRLQYLNNNKKALYPFFSYLEKAATSKGLIRIMHFGDSQIEGDRMTGYIRNKLQTQFGGTGPGMLPALNYTANASFNYKTTGNWSRHAAFDLKARKERDTLHSKYGATGTYCRFAPHYIVDTSKNLKEYEATLSFQPDPRSYRNFRTYQQCRMFYGNNKYPVIVQIYVNEELLRTDTLPVNNTVNVLHLDFTTTPENLEFRFKGKDSPDIYGITLDANKGIAMDNIPMRGSSGTIFTRINNLSLQQMSSHLNVRLLILQYGGNTVPSIKSKKACETYGRWFKSQIIKLKRMCPNASIIVVGPSDMSKKEKTSWVTHPFLPDVVEAMKKATFEAGGAYWDMYRVMGGKNSMPGWVENNLAGSDHIHFSRGGAKKMAQLLYEAIIIDYNSYKARKK